MRISLILLFAVVLQLPASNGYAQRTRGSFSMSSVSIENVLNKIEENSDYVFLYNNKTIQADRIVSVNSRSGKITEILDDMFRGTNVTYTLVDNQIILSTKQIKQQEPKIKVDGVVKDATGEPLIGVNVKVKNTIAGTITDLDGKFNLAVNKGDVLEISYVGYTTKEIKIIDDRILNVLLEEDSQKLNEVVVTALGIKRAEKALSYNVQQVKQDELVRVKDANFVNSLSGKIAGVSINKSASGVGGATRVVMRGAKSIEGDNNALYFRFQGVLPVRECFLAFQSQRCIVASEVRWQICTLEPSQRQWPYTFWRHLHQLQPRHEVLGRTPPCDGSHTFPRKCLAMHQDRGGFGTVPHGRRLADVLSRRDNHLQRFPLLHGGGYSG